MGDTACVVVHGYSCASSPTPSAATSIHGNAKHALGESISFGRFMTDEPLSWEKWSIFSHKKYVEEAERYAQTGSVAQKKAFFEAHYKKIVNQKAAALLEQQNEKSIGYSNDDNNNNNASKTDVDVKIEEVKIQDSNPDDDEMNNNEHSSIAAVDNGTDGEENAASIKSNVAGNTEKSRPAKRRPSYSKYLRTLVNLVLIREPDGDPISAAKKTESSPKECSTDTASSTESEGVSYTQSDNKRMKIPRSNCKTSPKWHILSAVCSKSIRTEERTAIREKEKAGNKEFRKLTCSFCFKVVDSYSDGETPRNRVEKTTAIHPPRPAESKRSNSNKMDVSILVPPPPPPPPPPSTCLVKNSPSKNLSKI
ncbi:hypothetical protein OROGR_007594 [Orobanche gracilis]